MVNGFSPSSVLVVMQPAAPAFARLATLSVLLSVSGVSAFAQSNSPSSIGTIERTSTTAARDYDPAASPAHAQIPSNVVIAPIFRPVLESMLQRSGTFRRQCMRIANAQNLVVQMDFGVAPLPSMTRARMRMLRQGLRRTALIEIPALDDTVELIAHEFEHVIEQLDGVDLRDYARRSNSGVETAVDRCSFETLRARQVGRLVAQEVRQGPAPGRTAVGSRSEYTSSRR
jgi:hypothetical protein